MGNSISVIGNWHSIMGKIVSIMWTSLHVSLKSYMYGHGFCD